MGRKNKISQTSQDKVPFDRTSQGRVTLGEKLTRLEDEGTSDIYIPTITCWFDTLIGAQ